MIENILLKNTITSSFRHSIKIYNEYVLVNKNINKLQLNLNFIINFT